MQLRQNERGEQIERTMNEVVGVSDVLGVFRIREIIDFVPSSSDLSTIVQRRFKEGNGYDKQQRG